MGGKRILSKLILYLHNKPFQEMDIEIPDYEGLLFEDRCKARCEYVDVKKAELKLLYLRQVIKCQFEYWIELVVESKMEETLLINEN